MGEVYRVAIHHDNDCGYIEYDPDTKKVRVVLDDAVKRRAVESFLQSNHIIRVAQRTLRDFREFTVAPNQDLGTLKLVLTRLWQDTGVLVDWSRPVPTR
jgi:hypothetical protein